MSSSISVTIIRRYDKLSPLQWMRDIAPIGQVHSLSRTWDHDLATLAAPIARMHTSNSPHKSRRRRHSGKTVTPPILEPLKFTMIPTMLTRQTKRGCRADPLKLQSLSDQNEHPRSSILIALIPRTPLEKLLHRRAIRLQRWWRRISISLWYCRARRLQSYARVFLAKQQQILLTHRRKKTRKIFFRMQLAYVRLIVYHWKRIYKARILGVRLRYSVYNRWLLHYSFDEWQEQWKIIAEKNQKTIYFFNRYLSTRRKYYYFIEWVDFIWLKKQCRNFFIRRNFRAWHKYVTVKNMDKHAAIEAGRRKLEEKSARTIQAGWQTYLYALLTIAGNDDFTLEELHACATIIQANMARGPLGRLRFEAYAATHLVIHKLLTKTWKICSYRILRLQQESKKTFEIKRSERERIFLAECDLMSLQTQQPWEESRHGLKDIETAIEVMTSGADFVCLLDGTQKDQYLANQGLIRARRKRRIDTSTLAVHKFRKIDPPAFECRYCLAPFGCVANFNSHSCTTVNEMLNESHANIRCRWSDVRLHEELEKLTATELFDALTECTIDGTCMHIMQTDEVQYVP